MSTVEAIGFISTACICATLVPQIVCILRTRNTKGLSLSTYIIYDIGNVAGLAYGVMIGSAPVTVTSVVTLLTSSFVTLLIVRGAKASHVTLETDRSALQIAAALGFLSPQSDTAFAVGAVILDESGSIIATGYSRELGSTWHAEEVAIDKAQRVGADLRRATLYSSLEPCGERKSRPKPCAAVVAESGIRRVVFGAIEPRTFSQGQGSHQLRDAGVEVTRLDCVQEEFEAANIHVLDTTFIEHFAGLLGMAFDTSGSTYRVGTVSYRGLTGPALAGSPTFKTIGELRSFCREHIDAAHEIGRIWRETDIFPQERYQAWVATWQAVSLA